MPGIDPFTGIQLPPSGPEPQTIPDGTPISALPLASTLTGVELVPLVQGGVTVQAQLQNVAQFAAPPSPLPIANGGTGKSFTTPNAIQLGGPSQLIEVPPGDTGQLLVGETGAEPQWLDTGLGGQVLISNGGFSDPSWTDPAYLQGPPGPAGPSGVQGVQGVTGFQGPAGQQGNAGPSGQPGPTGPPVQFMNLLGSFSVQPPSSLPVTGNMPASFDSAGVPPSPIQFMRGQGIIDTRTGFIWVYVSTAFNAAGWINAGAMLGPQGPVGPIGATGPQGVPGIAGLQGVQGNLGPSGPNGATGPQGPQGAQGSQGVEGTQGPDGSQGIQGPTGIQGVTGPPGAPGQTASVIGSFSVQATSALPPLGNIPANWDSAGNPPTAIQMQVGQGFIDTRTSFVWLFVTNVVVAAGWLNLGAVVGPRGATGAQGPVGVQGPNGSAGPQGIPGPAGSQGAQGATGPQGVQGAPGSAGGTGPTGPAGPVGPPGTPVFVGSGPPAGPVQGDLWFDAVGLQLYIWFFDGSNGQWIPAIPN
jgi:hypothetical protein